MNYKYFLTIYTPTYMRPMMLARCIESVKAQKCQDFEHIVYHDTIGEGIPGMFRRLMQTCDTFQGRYVYVLQDDDWLEDERVIRDVRNFAWVRDHPPVIICKSRKDDAYLPLPKLWKKRPECGGIDLGNYIIRHDMFVKHRKALGTGWYGTDYDLIREIWDAGVRFTWYDRLICESNQFGQGRAEYVTGLA